MNKFVAVRSGDMGPIASAPDIDEPAAFSPHGIFELIERTAETIRSLQQDNDLVGAREQECRVQLERDRALWRNDLHNLRRTVEACLARAVAAEREVAEAKTQTRLAVQICRETQTRERAATARAEAAEERAQRAEQWLARFGEAMSTEFAVLIERRHAALRIEAK